MKLRILNLQLNAPSKPISNRTDELCIIPQFKTGAMHDVWNDYEGSYLCLGNIIYILDLDGGTNSKNRFLSLICSDVLYINPNTIFEHLGDDINITLFHPQLNPKPRHTSFIDFRRNFINNSYKDNKRLITLNWSEDTSVINFNKKFSTPWSAFYQKNNLSYSHISDYYIVYFSDEDLVKLLSYESNGFGTFQQFQQKLLSSDYFKNKNDLRWNLYLLMITDINSSSIKEIPTNEIENDENYARKYFLDLNELKSFLNKDDMFIKGQLQDKGGLQTHQLQTWIEILNKVELTGCISNKFSSSSFEDYLYNEKAFQDNTLILKTKNLAKKKNNVNIKIPVKITKVQMGKFRSHCFFQSPQIEPERVNLIHGTNGCGKTSFLEAIELSITNEIKRLKGFGEDFKDYPKTVVECEADDRAKFSYQSGREPAYYKAIENAWYGVPVGMGKSTLNEHFGRFNYFDADTAYKFALEESDGNKGKNDYGDRFAKLFFDESIVEMQKQWKRYKQEFEVHYNKLKKKITEEEEAIKALKAFISAYKHTGDFNETETNQLLEKLGFRYDKLTINKSENLLSYYQAVHECLVAMNKNVETIKDCDSIVEPNSIVNINVKKQSAIKNKESLDVKYQSNSKKKLELEDEINEFNTKIAENKSQKAINVREIAYCDDALKVWESIKNIECQPEKVNDKDELKKEIDITEKKITLVSMLNSKHPNLVDLTEDAISGWSEDEIRNMERELERITKEDSQLIGAFEFAESQLTKIEKLKSEIKRLANEYLSTNSNERACPLCGAEYSTNDELHRKIHNLISNDEKSDMQIAVIQKNKFNYEKQISELTEKLKDYKNRQRWYTQLMLAFDSIKYPGIFSVPSFSTVKQILEYVKSVLQCREKLQGEADILYYRLKILEDMGFTDNSIKTLKEFIGTNKLFKDFKSDDVNIANFVDYVLNKKNNLLLDNIKLDEAIATEQNAIDLSNASLSEINIEKELEQISKCIKEINILDNALVAFEQLSEYFIMQNIPDLNVWSAVFENAKERCRIAVDKLNEQYDIGKNTTELNRKEEHLKVSKKVFERCSTALNAFVDMPSLETAVSGFVNSNLERIKYLFKRLHRPKEFSDLKFGDDGCIWAFRGIDNIWVKTHQMSTGQRISIALSVMFTLYLAAENAPGFILLDEPVANMDDVHMLNLMDILREIALQGTQIFFTTANPDVAVLFRRKFSFFGNEYKHFNFVRQNDKGTKIYECLYDPNYEEYVSKKEVV